MQKPLHLFVLILCLLIGLIPASAQDEDMATVRVPSYIDSLTLEYAVLDLDTHQFILSITGSHPDGCEVEPVSTASFTDSTLDVQIYREISIAQTCIAELRPFELTMEIEQTDSPFPQYLVINQQVWEITAPDEDTENSGGTLELSEELALLPASIDNIDLAEVIQDNELSYELAISGGKAVGCDVPMITTIRKDGDNLIVGVWNAIETDGICPMMFINFEETVTVSATDLQDIALVAVNEYLINELETQTMSDTSKVMTNINSVTVNVMESSPMQISLSVSGEHPDGCDFPVMVDQERNGNTVMVTVYREVPNDVMCPMMLNPYEATIKLDGSFTSGSYTIDVNGTTKKVDI